MRGEGRLLRIGEVLVGWACRRLPRRIRDERYQEWVAELPVVLHDPEIRFSGRRAARMLGYALGTIRGAALPGRHRRRRRITRGTVLVGAMLIFMPAGLGLDVWNAVQTPGDWTSYFFAGLTLLGLAANLGLYLRRGRPGKARL
jgi:hypothetical protein